jgi:hypothetical protein
VARCSAAKIEPLAVLLTPASVSERPSHAKARSAREAAEMRRLDY